MKKCVVLLSLVFCSCGLSLFTGPSDKSNGNGFSEGMLSFTFDDGRACAYDSAIPTLDRAGIRGTSYIIVNYLTNQNDYVTKANVLSLEARGHEIGSHTRTHRDLTTIPASELDGEISGSRQDLLALGLRDVRTLAYPFGHFNQAIIDVTKGAGYFGARSTKFGQNDRSTDKFALIHENLGGNVFIIEVQNWIDQAIRNKTWLILLAHHVDHTPGDYSITPELFADIVNYAVSKKIKTVTVREGLRLM